MVVWSSCCHLLSDVHELAHMYLQAQKYSNGSTGEGGGEKGCSMAGGKEDDVQGLEFGNMSDLASTLQSPLFKVYLLYLRRISHFYEISWKY